jgi:hypothetical protein
VVDEIKDRFAEVATHNQGLCVVKVLIAKTSRKEDREALLGKVTSQAISLA